MEYLVRYYFEQHFVESVFFFSLLGAIILVMIIGMIRERMAGGQNSDQYYYARPRRK